MNVKVSLFNSTTDDLTIVIDLLRASTTITVALNTFNKIIPVNNIEKALELKSKSTILAGELDLNELSGFDITNSPEKVQKYSNDKLILMTTNGTKVLENIKKRNKDITVLIGSSINARSVAKESLNHATDEIELIMAGKRGKFNIEDTIGAGLIIEQIINIAKEDNINITLDESAKAASVLVKNHTEAIQMIEESSAAKRLKKLNLEKDVEISKQLNKSTNVGIYENGQIHLI